MPNSLNDKIISLVENEMYRLAEDFHKNMDYTMSNNQVYGIESIFSSSGKNVETLKRYLQHQSKKAQKKGHTQEATFFNRLYTEFNTVIPGVIREQFPGITTQEKKEIIMELSSGYIQHFIAHHLYLHPR